MKTRKIYSTSLRDYTAHCALNDFNSPLSVIVNSFISWIVELSIKRIKVDIIKSYLIDVKSAHVNMRFEDLSVFQNSQLQRIIVGSRRL